MYSFVRGYTLSMPLLFYNEVFISMSDPYLALIPTTQVPIKDNPTEFISYLEPGLISDREACVMPVLYDSPTAGVLRGLTANFPFVAGRYPIPAELRAIYLIIDRVSQCWYVGSTINLSARIGKHLSLLKLGTHPNPGIVKVHTAATAPLWVKFIAFPYQTTVETLRSLEQEVLDAHNDHVGKCNIAIDAINPQTGRHISEVHKLIIKNRVITKETKLKLKELGKKRGAISKENRWISVNGEVFHSLTEAGRKLHMSSSSIFRMANNSLYPNCFFIDPDHPVYNGKVAYSPSEEVRRKMSERLTGVSKSDKHKAKLSAANKGTRPSDATIAASVAAKSKAVEVNGVVYPSSREAGRVLGIGKSTILYRIKSKYPGYRNI